MRGTGRLVQSCPRRAGSGRRRKPPTRRLPIATPRSASSATRPTATPRPSSNRHRRRRRPKRRLPRRREPEPAPRPSPRAARSANAASAGPAGTFPSPSRAARRTRPARPRPAASAPRWAVPRGGAANGRRLPEGLGRRAEVLGDQLDGRALGLAVPAGADDRGEGQAAGRDHEHVHQSIGRRRLRLCRGDVVLQGCLQIRGSRIVTAALRHPSPRQSSWFRWSRCVVPAYSRRKRPRRCSSGTTRPTNSSIAPGQ